MLFHLPLVIGRSIQLAFLIESIPQFSENNQTDSSPQDTLFVLEFLSAQQLSLAPKRSYCKMVPQRGKISTCGQERNSYLNPPKGQRSSEGQMSFFELFVLFGLGYYWKILQKEEKREELPAPHPLHISRKRKPSYLVQL